jgi:predicted O-methyltransferase YrrM
MRDRFKRLEMRARAALPASLRTAYRTARALTAKPGSAPPFPQDLVADCRMFGTRLDLIDSLPKGGRVAELGTYKGDFAREILHRCAPRELHVMDIDYTLFDNTLRTDPRVTCHTGLTHAMVGAFPDQHFDWIYVDADHGYPGVVRDIEAAAPKVKIGGYLVFNDFAHVDPFMGQYGVQQAVTEFAVRERWPMSHFAMHGAALYDVAFQRPAVT